jgi:hypothetical protein
MDHQDKMEADGVRNDGVSYELAASHLQVYAKAREQLKAFDEPVLLHANNPHERIFFAALDGTGNDLIDDPEHATNVGLIATQIQASKNPHIAAGYVAGTGTQQHRPIARTLDGARGYTVDERAEELYKQFIERAWQWKQEDPDAKISAVSVGFSRGSEEVALFTRLVEERGIQDPAGARYTYDSHHQIKHVEYTRPPLEPPHQTAQAVVMFDPVGTGAAMQMDRRLPPSVISGIQLTALDEHRGLFKSDHIIDPGLTPDGRFAGIYVPGAHSDVGGGYNRNGLPNRSGNFGIDYINGLSDKPILDKLPEPDDPRLNVIHHSTEGMWLYRVAPKIDRLSPDGFNDLEVARRALGHVLDAYNAEPRNEILSDRFERQAMPNAPLPANPQQAHASTVARDPWIDHMYAASQNPDDHAWDTARHAAAQDYLSSSGGMQFQQQADAMNSSWDAQLQINQQAQAAQQAMQQGQQNAQGPAR